MAVGQWGIETPFAWRSSQSEKTLWDCVYDPLIQRDAKTFAYRPGLATEWKPSNELRTWTFKLRSGVAFHENWGELTAEDVKFTVEQNLRPDVPGGSAPFFRNQLERIETPDKLTVVMHFKNRVWEVPSHFTQFVGYQNITSKKYLETVGEEKAALHPIGTGPYRHVEGKQGDYHRFEAIANHWRKAPGFKELVIRRIPDAATRVAGLRSGEIDIGQVFGDYLDQTRKAGLRIHETPNAACYWVVLQGQTTPDREDYCPTCPWVGDPGNAESLAKARKVRMALNLAVNKKAIINALWKGTGAETPFTYFYYPFNKGYSTDWKIPPYDAGQAKKLLAEAGQGGGFEVRVNPWCSPTPSTERMSWRQSPSTGRRSGSRSSGCPRPSGTSCPRTARARRTRRIGCTALRPSTSRVSPGSARSGPRAPSTSCVRARTIKSSRPILREVDAEKRAQLTRAMGQKLYDQYPAVMLGVKSTTWAVSKQVSGWQTLVYVPLENNYEYVSTGA